MFVLIKVLKEIKDSSANSKLTSIQYIQVENIIKQKQALIQILNPEILNKWYQPRTDDGNHNIDDRAKNEVYYLQSAQ